MMSQKASHPEPVVAYSTLVGRVVASYRDRSQITQATVAAHLELSPSAYSRLESGGSTMNISQLRQICEFINVPVYQVMKSADQYERQLIAQGVRISHEKQESNRAALAIGIGLLTAVLLGS